MRFALCGAAVVLALSGCSSSGHSSSKVSKASSTQAAAVTSVIDKYAASTTGQQLCAVITRAYEDSISHLGAAPTVAASEVDAPASPSCPAEVAAAAKAGQLNLTASSVSVSKVLVQGGAKGTPYRAAALANTPQPAPFYLIDGPSGWLIVSQGAAPPDFSQLAATIK